MRIALLSSSVLIVHGLIVVGLAACPKPEAGTAGPGPLEATASATASAVEPEHHEGGEPEEHEHSHAGAEFRDKIDADGVVRRGEPLSALEATPVSVAVQKAKELDGKLVKLTGTVTDVCTRKGCWFVVRGEKGDDIIRISTKAHNIFVPRAAVGMKAVIEGTLSIKTLSKASAQHFEDERELQAGETRKTFTGDVVELAIDVKGLEMRKG